jgi:uncharacterized SAM-binding protein YcdF (DUF218 family)
MTQMTAELREAHHILEFYLGRTDSIRQVEVLIIFGTWDLAVPRHAVKLLQSWPTTRCVVTGARGRHTANQPTSEASVFVDILSSAGVDEDRILVDHRARNTQENIQNSLSLLEETSWAPSAYGLIMRQLQSRRTYLTFAKYCGSSALTFPPPNTIGSPVYGGITENVQRLLDELDRLQEYDLLGRINQEDPTPGVLSAASALRAWLSDTDHSA